MLCPNPRYTSAIWREARARRGIARGHARFQKQNHAPGLSGGAGVRDRRSSWEAGFTFAELLAVLLISGIITALAAPSFTGWVQGSRLDGAVGQVASDLAYARILAVRSSAPATVTFSASEYTIDQADRPTPLKRTRVTEQYPGLTLSATPASVEFDSRGLMRGTSAVVRVTDAGSGRQMELRINATGRVRRVY